MSAEHRRPLVAFILVAVVCALIVGQSMRDAAQRLVGGGLPLGALVRIAPDMLFTIDALGANGLGGDVPYVGRAILAVSSPAPPAAPIGPAVATTPTTARTTAVQTTAVQAPAVRTAARSVASKPTRAGSRQISASPRRTAPSSSGTPATSAPVTPTLTPGHTKHAARVPAPGARHQERGSTDEVKRGPDTMGKSTHHRADHNQGPRAGSGHAAQGQHAKPHPHAKPTHQERHHQHGPKAGTEHAAQGQHAKPHPHAKPKHQERHHQNRR